MPLEEALNEFEKGVKLAKTGQQTLQKAEQRVQILLKPDENAGLNAFTPDSH
ncbi:Exodeoxyribonuclease 7 small subunit [Tatumella ptyseos]|uniref:Exodeoxyribonuclease VII small subunit n=1 Tax=Tatumella ptyseos TaxID=82987 RepID=A0A2X5NJV2_9GAMM|nr:Exodeoxyribonuclease 7 small subunit [Tatumella ptyseos]